MSSLAVPLESPLIMALPPFRSSDSWESRWESLGEKIFSRVLQTTEVFSLFRLPFDFSDESFSAVSKIEQLWLVASQSIVALTEKVTNLFFSVKLKHWILRFIYSSSHRKMDLRDSGTSLLEARNLLLSGHAWYNISRRPLLYRQKASFIWHCASQVKR